MGFLVVLYSMWQLVQLAHNTLPDNAKRPSQQWRLDPLNQQYPDDRRSVDKIPILPSVPKVNPLPDMELVAQWMKAPRNETAGQFLLDFAIIGNAKCGTTTMMNWLYQQYPHIQIPRDELYHLKSKEPWDLLGVFYHYFGGKQKLIPQSIKGYKSPSDITSERVIRILREYFPQTKLMIGLRHPIFMMESFYNFRIQNGYDMPPFDQLHYRNLANQYGVSWSRAEYHSSLMYLGKTNLTSQLELSLMPKLAQKQIQQQLQKTFQESRGNEHGAIKQTYPRAPNPVFLYETGQLEGDPVRLEQFGRDVANFLGLTITFPPPPKHVPGQKLQNSTLQEARDGKKILICEERYRAQRQQLMEIGDRTTKWILNYFLPAHDVYVSNLLHFRQLLQGYSQDPCENNEGRES